MKQPSDLILSCELFVNYRNIVLLLLPWHRTYIVLCFVHGRVVRFCFFFNFLRIQSWILLLVHMRRMKTHFSDTRYVSQRMF